MFRFVGRVQDERGAEEARRQQGGEAGRCVLLHGFVCFVVCVGGEKDTAYGAV
jgi:hypothetical protein